MTEPEDVYDYTGYKTDVLPVLDKYIKKNEHIMNYDGYKIIRHTLSDYLKKKGSTFELTTDIFDKICKYALSKTDRDTYQAMEAMQHNFCTLQSRSGGQTPFSSINFGTDTSEEGRMVTKNILLNVKAGLGSGETAIFPISIFKILKGVTDKGSKNYDLFRLACEVSAVRAFPNFVNVSAPMNFKYYIPGRPETEIATMGCRTRVIGNHYDKNHQQTTGRGNLFFTTINLPYIALEALEKYPDDEAARYHEFMKILDERIDDAMEVNRQRFEYISHRKAKNLPFLMGQHLYIGSENLGPEDEIGEVIKQGSISVGFIGLAETLTALFGKHHGESEKSQQYGLTIIGHMNDLMHKFSEEENMNYSLFATPAEGCSGRLLKACRKRFGIVPGVTDKLYLTNSVHVPVSYKISAFDKVNIEAPYHPLCEAGIIGYIELDYDATKNIDAFETLVNYMADSGMTYFSINHPVDHDPVCGYFGYIPVGGVCPRCGRKEGEGVTVRKLLSLKSYSPTPEFAIDRDMLALDDAVPNDL